MLLFFNRLFYVSAFIMILLAVAYLVIIYRISKGKTLTEQAQHVLKIEQFHQTHPAVRRLANQSRHWRFIAALTMIAAILLSAGELIFLPNLFPNFGSAPSLLTLLAILAIGVTVTTGRHLVIDHRLRQVYRQHDLLLGRTPHLHAFLLTYQLAMLLFTYEVLGLATAYVVLMD